MNIVLSKVNKLVISHGHDDHTGGLKYFLKKREMAKELDIEGVGVGLEINF